jgi:hypothetical protein
MIVNHAQVESRRMRVQGGESAKRQISNPTFERSFGIVLNFGAAARS